MANNLIIKTVPGFTLESPNFTVNFISGYEGGVVSELLKYETDWMDAMTLILSTLEKFPTSVEFTEKFLATALENLVLSQEGGDYFNIKASVKLRDRAFFCPPFGTTKMMTLAFTDSSKTEVLFLVKKKTIIRSLKDIAAEAVVDKLKTEDDIAKLDIPLSLIHNLVKECQNDWNGRYYRSNIECCKQHREGSRAFHQFCLYQTI